MIGSATFTESLYFDSNMPNEPAMPQQPASSIVTSRCGIRVAS